MTSATTFTIDGTLAPADARQVLEGIGLWVAAGEGVLDIHPVPAPPELPTQPALQILFAAAAELSRRHEVRLAPGAQALCDTLLGKRALAGTAVQEVYNG